MTRKTGEPRKFTVGQAVSVRDYCGKQKWIPGIVKAQTGPVSYQVQVGSQMVWRRHVDQLLDADTGQTVELNAPAETSADWYPTSQTDAPEPNNQQVAQQPVVRPEAPRGAAPKITRSGRTVKRNPEKVYFRSQILERPSISEYWNNSGVPVLPENVIFITFFRTCWWHPEVHNTRTQKWSSIVQYSCTSIWDL